MVKRQCGSSSCKRHSSAHTRFCRAFRDVSADWMASRSPTTSTATSMATPTSTTTTTATPSTSIDVNVCARLHCSQARGSMFSTLGRDMHTKPMGSTPSSETKFSRRCPLVCVRACVCVLGRERERVLCLCVWAETRCAWVYASFFVRLVMHSFDVIRQLSITTSPSQLLQQNFSNRIESVRRLIAVQSISCLRA